MFDRGGRCQLLRDDAAAAHGICFCCGSHGSQTAGGKQNNAKRFYAATAANRSSCRGFLQQLCQFRWDLNGGLELQCCGLDICRTEYDDGFAEQEQKQPKVGQDFVQRRLSSIHYY